MIGKDTERIEIETGIGIEIGIEMTEETGVMTETEGIMKNLTEEGTEVDQEVGQEIGIVEEIEKVEMTEGVAQERRTERQNLEIDQSEIRMIKSI